MKLKLDELIELQELINNDIAYECENNILDDYIILDEVQDAIDDLEIAK